MTLLKKLALYSQMLEKKTEGVYTYIQRNYFNFFGDKIPNLSKILDTERVLTKKVFMCYTYGQKGGRYSEILYTLQEEGFGSLINDVLKEEIRLFCEEYELYIDFLFDGLSVSLSALKKLNMAVTQANGGQIIVKTLDGCYCK